MLLDIADFGSWVWPDDVFHNYRRLRMRSGGPGAGVAGRDGCIYSPCPCRLLPLRRSSYCMQVKFHTCVYTYGYAHWGERAATGTASSPMRVQRAAMFDGSPGLLRWRCRRGGGFPLQYVRACFMTHLFLTLGSIPCDDVYIIICVYIFIRNILWLCTVVFLLMSASFTMYMVRDDLVNKWNQIIQKSDEIPQISWRLSVKIRRLSAWWKYRQDKNSSVVLVFVIVQIITIRQYNFRQFALRIINMFRVFVFCFAFYTNKSVHIPAYFIGDEATNASARTVHHTKNACMVQMYSAKKLIKIEAM